MSRTCIILVVTVLLSLLNSSTYAQNKKHIYIATNGNDNNPGTKQKPIATLIKARDLIRLVENSSRFDSIHVIIEPGNYYISEPLVFDTNDSRPDQTQISFRGINESFPVIYGGYKVENFTKVNDHLWKADVPTVRKSGKKFEQLYINGNRATRAQTPNYNFYHPLSVSEIIIEQAGKGQAKSAVQRIKLPLEVINQISGLTYDQLRNITLRFYHNWDNTIRTIQSLDVSDSTITIHGKGMKPWNRIDKKSLLTIENSMVFLDEPGEWFLENDGTLYYYPKKGETIESVNCVAPLINQFITIKGNSKSKIKNIIFENISFKGSLYNLPKDGFEPSQSASQVQASIELDYTENIHFSNCEISQTGAYAIWFRRSCSNNSITHSYLHDLGAGAIKIGETVIRDSLENITNKIIVDNNIIKSGGHVLPCAAAVIIFNARDNSITHNDIGYFRYTGVSAGWVWGYSESPAKNNLIAFNHIHHLGYGLLSDLGGVYTLGQSEGTVISNNVIHHITGREYGGWGLYADQGSSGILMENNLVYSCSSSGFTQHFGTANIIQNNIFALNKSGELELGKIEEHQSLTFTNNIVFSEKNEIFLSYWAAAKIVSKNNCYWNKNGSNLSFGGKSFIEWKKMGKDSNSLVINPNFVNPQKYDFHFKNTSTTKRVNFKPFNYEKAGAYGSAEWKKKSRLSNYFFIDFNDLSTHP